MAARARTLQALQEELRAAEDVHEDAYAARLRAEIQRLSAGSPVHPARETAARPAGEGVTSERPVRPRRARAGR